MSLKWKKYIVPPMKAHLYKRYLDTRTFEENKANLIFLSLSEKR